MRKKNVSEITAVLTGMAAAIIICAGFVAGISHLVLSGAVGETGLEIIICGVVLLSSAVGGLLTRKQFGNPIIGSAVIICLLLLLMITIAMLLDGPFKNVLPRIISLIIGGIAACTFSIKAGRKRNNRKRRYR